MEQFDAAIIGFGTAGLALGGALADDGQNIVVVEQSDTMYGGACVNNACIPTKALVESARLTAAVGGPIVEREERYTAAVDDMKELRSPRANATTARWRIARTSTSSTAAHRSRTPRT